MVGDSRSRSGKHGDLAGDVPVTETLMKSKQLEVINMRLDFMSMVLAVLARALPPREALDGAMPVDDTRPHVSVPPGRVVSMFGFDCDDPLAGVAPGTRRGELCTSFMGCFTCPNAIIAPDPATVARLLQARDHLRGAAATLHPARWQAFYAPQLRILEEDILPRFGMRELAAGQLLVARLPALPDLR